MDRVPTQSTIVEWSLEQNKEIVNHVHLKKEPWKVTLDGWEELIRAEYPNFEGNISAAGFY